jgi:hypothetical protein
VLPEANDTVSRSARNIPGVTVLPVAGLNVLDILRHKNLALTKDAVERITARFKKNAPAPAEPAPKKRAPRKKKADGAAGEKGAEVQDG